MHRVDDLPSVREIGHFNPPPHVIKKSSCFRSKPSLMAGMTTVFGGVLGFRYTIDLLQTIPLVHLPRLPWPGARSGGAMSARRPSRRNLDRVAAGWKD